MDNQKQPQSDTFGTLLKWAVGGFIVWNLLPPSVKENTVRSLSRIGDALADYQRHKAELEKQERIRKILNNVLSKPLFVSNPTLISTDLPTQSAVSGTSLITKETLPVISFNTPPTKAYVEPDSIWLKRVVHPSVVLILGKRGSGKSALGYRLLELFRYGSKPYAVGVPSTARSILPDWIGMASCLEDVPTKAIAVI